MTRQCELRKRTTVHELRGDTLAGKHAIAAYLHTLEVDGLRSAIRTLESLRAPRPGWSLNSEQLGAIDHDLTRCRSKLEFHMQRRSTSMQQAAHHAKR